MHLALNMHLITAMADHPECNQSIETQRQCSELSVRREEDEEYFRNQAPHQRNCYVDDEAVCSGDDDDDDGDDDDGVFLELYKKSILPAVAPAKVVTTEKVPFERCARLRAEAAIGRTPGARVITADQGPHRARSTRARGSDIPNGVTQFASRV